MMVCVECGKVIDDGSQETKYFICWDCIINI